ncbi:hypothetical protein VNO77_03924 [Canavalia gladiata]|uniref:Uncharacterized protein n=1 Tax=Canavalia gladiata TaxID=3824 RepID=A0AAN9N198_CANGL
MGGIPSDAPRHVSHAFHMALLCFYVHEGVWDCFIFPINGEDSEVSRTWNSCYSQVHNGSPGLIVASSYLGVL